MGVKTDAFFAWNWHQNDNCSMLAWEQSSFFNCARKFAEWISSSFLDDMLLTVPFSLCYEESESTILLVFYDDLRFDLSQSRVREIYAGVFSEGDGAVFRVLSLGFSRKNIFSQSKIREQNNKIRGR